MFVNNIMIYTNEAAGVWGVCFKINYPVHMHRGKAIGLSVGLSVIVTTKIARSQSLGVRATMSCTPESVINFHSSFLTYIAYIRFLYTASLSFIQYKGNRWWQIYTWYFHWDRTQSHELLQLHECQIILLLHVHMSSALDPSIIVLSMKTRP